VKPLADILRTHRRIAIVGGPRTGKSTLAAQVRDRPVIATDDTKDHPWEDQPEIAKRRVEGHESFCLEGVQAARALRKGLEVDAIIVLTEPKEARSKGQRAMAAGQEKIIREALAMHPGVTVYREGSDSDA
jgi:hypothetical protein